VARIATACEVWTTPIEFARIYIAGTDIIIKAVQTDLARNIDDLKPIIHWGCSGYDPIFKTQPGPAAIHPVLCPTPTQGSLSATAELVAIYRLVGLPDLIGELEDISLQAGRRYLGALLRACHQPANFLQRLTHPAMPLDSHPRPFHRLTR
jgi:hypothetical protein